MNIVIAAFERALPSGLVGLVDMFWLAQRALAAANADFCTVRTASIDGAPIHDGRGRTLVVDLAFDDIRDCDAVLIPGFVPDANGRPPLTSAIKQAGRWIADQHTRGALVCGSCSGVFVLGEAGLLDDRRCTTTWWLFEELRRRYPHADPAWGAALIEDRRVITAGGPMSWIDLSLRVIRILAGADAARAAADFSVVDGVPLAQAVYVPQGHVAAADPFLITAEQAVREASDTGIGTASLAQHLSMSERTLQRRLKALCGESPRAFIERVRFETARTLLETGTRAIKDVSASSGYQDEATFRRAFARHAGMTPSAFREWSRQRRIES